MRHAFALVVLIVVAAGTPGCGRESALGGPVSGPVLAETTFFKAMTQAGYTPLVFSGAPVTSSIAALNKAHVNTLAIQLGWYQQTPTSTKIRPEPTKTPTDASLVSLIRRAHAAGMYVFLNPFVNALTIDDWQADFHPASWHAWFTGYDAFLRHYATIARNERVELFSIGDESDSADSDPALYPEWKKAITQVRAIYKGPVTYGADWPNYKTVTFWKDLDYVGIDAYFSLAPNGVDHPSLASLESAWTNIADEIESWRQASGLGTKPFFVAELGYYSGVGVAAEPAFWRPKAAVDLAAQADCYRATLNTIYRRPWLKGVTWFWWANPSNPHWQGGSNNNGYTIRNKPAYGVLAKGFASPRAYAPQA